MSGPPIRVVLADDTDDMRRMLRLALDLAGGFDVVAEAGDGEAAVGLAKGHRPDAVVLDLAMPVMDGLQAIPLIREASPLTRILVLSGFNAAHLASEARTLGADAYLEKGVAFSDIAGLLRELVDGGHLGNGQRRSHPGPEEGMDGPHREEVEPSPTLRSDTEVDGPLPLAARLAGAPNLDVAFQCFATAAGEMVSFDRVGYAAKTDEPGRFRVLASAGDAAWRMPVGVRLSFSGEATRGLHSGRPFVVDDTSRHRDLPLAREAHARGLRSFVSVPIVVAGGLQAIVTFSSLETLRFGADTVEALKAVVDDVAGVLHVIALLDEERESARRLRDLDRLRNDFVSMVAHDLRAPMTVIQGFADGLDRGWAELSEELKREFVETIARNTRNVAALVEDVLTVSHIQSREFQLDVRPLDLTQVLRDAVGELARSDGARQIVLDIPERPAPVYGDAVRQRQVIMNLIGNAIKFSTPTDTVVVAARVVDGVFEVSVRDHGIGIVASDIDRLFERFFRTDEGRRHDRSGTGLGLFICKSLVESWGGTIRVESRLGTGSLFTYTTPLASSLDTSAGAAAPVRASSA